MQNNHKKKEMTKKTIAEKNNRHRLTKKRLTIPKKQKMTRKKDKQ